MCRRDAVKAVPANQASEISPGDPSTLWLYRYYISDPAWHFRDRAEVKKELKLSVLNIPQQST